jgi:hypothetical protein
MMVEASPATAFEMTEADLLLELEIVALDAPAQLGLADEIGELGLHRQGREPILGRFALALRPLDQEPFLGPGCRMPVVAMRRPDAHGGEARAQRRWCPLAR